MLPVLPPVPAALLGPVPAPVLGPTLGPMPSVGVTPLYEDISPPSSPCLEVGPGPVGLVSNQLLENALWGDPTIGAASIPSQVEEPMDVDSDCPIGTLDLDSLWEDLPILGNEILDALPDPNMSLPPREPPPGFPSLNTPPSEGLNLNDSDTFECLIYDPLSSDEKQEEGEGETAPEAASSVPLPDNDLLALCNEVIKDLVDLGK